MSYHTKLGALVAVIVVVYSDIYKYYMHPFLFWMITFHLQAYNPDRNTHHLELPEYDSSR